MKLTVKARVISGFAFMVLLIVGLGLLSLLSVQRVQGLLAETYHQDLQGVDYTSQVLSQLHNLRVGAHRLVGAPTPEREAMIKNTLTGDMADYRALLGKFEQTALVAGGVVSIEAFEAKAERFIAVIDQAMVLKRTRGATAAAWQLERDGRDRFIEAETELLDVHKRIQGLAKDRFERSTQAAAWALWQTAGFLALALAAGLALSTLMVKAIVAPIQAIAQAAIGIANGQLDQAIDTSRQDEIGEMARAFARMTEVLQDVIFRVRGVAESVVAGTSQISASTEQMARHAMFNAEATEETSASMEEMAASIRQVAGGIDQQSAMVRDASAAIEEMTASIQQVAGNADSLSSSVSQTSASIQEMAITIRQVSQNVETATHLSSVARNAAEGGSEAVTQTIAGMGRIRQVMGEVTTVIEGLDRSSGEIGNIVELIDDIAEQTNLLALNAAIEAARAGEHGRGFAVVADEVRKLAERAAKATKEIADLIKGIQKETDQAIASTRQGQGAIADGAALAQQAGEALEAIVRGVSEVTTLMDQVNAATQEQATASGQILQASEHMSRLTHQVASATGEQARSSEQVMQAIGTIQSQTRQALVATGEQRKSSETVVAAVEQIRRASQESAGATGEVARAVGDLEQQAQQLFEALSYFKTSRDAQRPRLDLTVRQAEAERQLALTSGRDR